MVFEMILLNSLLVMLIGFGLCVWARFSQKPGLIHFVWLVLLIKLMMPPVLSLPVLPRIFSPATEVAANEKAIEDVSDAFVLVPQADTAQRFTGLRSKVPLIVWSSVALLLILYFSMRGWQFSKIVRRARPPEPSLKWLIQRLSRDIGFPHAPKIVVVDISCAPAIWSWFRPATLILPSGLFSRLRKEELEGVILHELAHIRRRDHWIRPFEVLAISLLWWNPVFWWVRNHLRAVEEQCCDAWVNGVRPTQCRAYADGLIKTVAFVSGHAPALLAGFFGLGRLGFLERRLIAIMKRKHQVARVGVWIRPLVVIGAALILAVYPTWGKIPGSVDQEDPAESQKLILEQQRLKAEAESLNRALQENQALLKENEMKLKIAQEEKIIAEFEAQARIMEVQEDKEEAERLARLAESRKKALEIQKHQFELQMERHQEMTRNREQQKAFEKQLHEAVKEKDRELVERMKEREKAAQEALLKREAEIHEKHLQMELVHTQRERELREELHRLAALKEAEAQHARQERLEHLTEEAHMKKAREMAKIEQERLEAEREMIVVEEARRLEQAEVLREERELLRKENREREKAMLRAHMEDRMVEIRREVALLEERMLLTDDVGEKKKLEERIAKSKNELEKLRNEIP